MKYIADANGFLKEVAFGASISCGDENCTEYTGTIPDGHETIDDWYEAECENLCQWKVVDGNLVQDTTTEPSDDISLFDFVHPVGSIYLSVTETSPEVLFGFGTWERIQDTFLLCAGSTYGAGSTGGAAEVALSADQMPSHNHSVTIDSAGGHSHGFTTGDGGAHSHTVGYGTATNTATGGSGTRITGIGNYTTKGNTSTESSHSHSGTTNSGGGHSHTVTEQSMGGGQAHENMPPYLAVYVWQRTA